MLDSLVTDAPLALLALAAAGVLALVVFACRGQGGRARAKAAAAADAAGFPPGMEPSDPALGNLGDVGKAGSLQHFLRALHGQYGQVASFHWMKQPVVSLCSAAGYKAVARLFDRPKPLFALFEPMIGPGSLQYANGDEGRSRRREYVDPAFTHQAIRGMYWGFQRVAREVVEQWRGLEQVPLHADMMQTALRGIVLTALGGQLDDDECGRLFEAYKVAWGEMEDRVAGSFPADGDGRAERFEEALGLLHRTSDRMAAERAGGAGGEDPCFLDALLGAGISDAQRRSEVVTMMVGGSHTTGNALTWALYYVARHPQVQRRAVEELRRVVPAGARVPDFDSVRRLEYMGRVVHETLRCSVLAPWAARVSDSDQEVLGHRVPAGTPILLALGVTLTDPAVWDEPERFDPDRFLPERKREVPSICYSPFGFAGKRPCPGSRYAHYETVAVMAAVLSAYELSLPDGYEAQPVHGLVTSPAEEVPLRLRPRA